jgi:hypothetical protein
METNTATITARDRKLAMICLHCTVCKRARKKQRGVAYWLVKRVEGHVCPFCKAYERVYGRKAHEPLGGDAKREN